MYSETSPIPQECSQPWLYHWNDDGEFTNWLRENPQSNTRESKRVCYLEWADGAEGLATIADDVLEEGIYMVGKMSLPHVRILRNEELSKEPLNFVTTLTSNTIGANMAGYPKGPCDWYGGNTDQPNVQQGD